MLHWTPGRLLCFVSDATSPAPVSTVVGQHDIHMTGNDIIRSAFDPVAGLPCWQVLGEFGTYLTFHFGIPKVHVTEPTEAIRHRRLAGVDGQCELCLATYQWVAFQDGERVAQSESPRDVIRKVAATFQGQKLTALTVRTKPAGGEFVFDLGGRLAYRCETLTSKRFGPSARALTLILMTWTLSRLPPLVQCLYSRCVALSTSRENTCRRLRTTCCKMGR